MESSFDGDAQFGYAELGYAGICTPYLAVHATRVDLDTIEEVGDATFGLSNDGGDGESLRSVLGITYGQSAITPLGLATTGLRFGWLHEYLEESETFVSRVGGSSAELTDRGVSAGRDWGFVRAQLGFPPFLGGHWSFAYEGQFNSRSSFNAFLGGAVWAY